jgi:hypothetical protein
MILIVKGGPTGYRFALPLVHRLGSELPADFTALHRTGDLLRDRET